MKRYNFLPKDLKELEKQLLEMGCEVKSEIYLDSTGEIVPRCLSVRTEGIYCNLYPGKASVNLIDRYGEKRWGKKIRN